MSEFASFEEIERLEGQPVKRYVPVPAKPSAAELAEQMRAAAVYDHDEEPESSATVQPEATAPVKNAQPDQPKQRVGRKPDPDSSIPRVFDSISQCSAVTGIPVAALRAAKKADDPPCPAFRHSRVDLVAYLKWRFGLSEDAIEDWGNDLKMWKAKREKIAHDKDAGTVADRSEVTFAVGKAMAVLFSSMDRQFGNSLPPVLKGLDEAGIQQRLLSAVETFKSDVRQSLSTIQKPIVDTEPKQP